MLMPAVTSDLTRSASHIAARHVSIPETDLLLPSEDNTPSRDSSADHGTQERLEDIASMIRAKLRNIGPHNPAARHSALDQSRHLYVVQPLHELPTLGSELCPIGPRKSVLHLALKLVIATGLYMESEACYNT